MTTPDAQIRQQLDAVQGYLLRLLEHVGKVEAERDRLALLLADNEGAPDKLPIAVR